MKKKLREDLQTSSLDRSSDALVESSFSKVTFRKRSRIGNSEVMPVIGEEEGFPGSQNVANSDGESPAKKKKRKRKNKESISGKVNSTLDSICSEKGNEIYASVDEEFGFDSSMQCDGSDLKREKRKKVKNIEDGELGMFSGSKVQEIDDFQAEERLHYSNYSIDPVHHSTHGHSEKKKNKNKNKHKLKDFMGDDKLDEEKSPGQESDDLEVSLNTVSPVKAKKSKHSKSMNKADEIPLKLQEQLNSTFSSPLFGKKKKTKNLVDESCLQENSIVDNNLSVISLDVDANPSPKKKRKSSLLDEIGLILSNSGHLESKNEIKEGSGEDFECLPDSETMVSAKKLKRKSKSPKKTLSVHQDSLKMDSENCDHKSKTETPAREMENKKIKNIAKDFCSKGSLEKSNKKKKKTKHLDDMEAMKTQLLAQAFSNVKEPVNVSKKSSKPEKSVSLKKQLLQEAIGCLETSGGAALKSNHKTAPITMAKENSEDLRKRLLSEALSVKQNIKSKPVKSKKPKTEGMDSADANLTKKIHKSEGKLLKKPVSHVKNKHSVKSDDLDKLTDVLISKALEKLSSSGASHSSQENINCLNTEKISKKHSLKENINCSNTEKTRQKSVWDEPSFKKVARNDKAKAKLVSEAQINDERKFEVKDIESKAEREEIKKALLNSALKQLKSRAKSSDSKKKQEPH